MFCSRPFRGWRIYSIARTLLRLGRALVDVYCSSFRQVPRRIVLDINNTFDAVHGSQQLRLFNAYYDEYGFPPMVIFDGEGRFVTALLRPAKRPKGIEAWSLFPSPGAGDPQPLARGRILSPRRQPLRVSVQPGRTGVRFGVRLRASDRSDQQATAMGWLCSSINFSLAMGRLSRKVCIGFCRTTAVICERFHKTMLDEFYRVACKKLYRSLAELQADLDQWAPPVQRAPHDKPLVKG